jgi:hypothetical protein
MPSLALAASDFSTYPPQARHLAVAHLELLEKLPQVFAAILLREIVAYDWKFPAERTQLEDQLQVLTLLPVTELESRMQTFASIDLSTTLQRTNWIGDPAGFMEQLTAWLWSSSQMEQFRKAAESYANFLAEASPAARPRIQRLGIVVIGEGVEKTEYRLFRKLRPQGLYLNNIQPENGWSLLIAEVTRRAANDTSGAYRHWYIDGASCSPHSNLTQVSYESLLQPRELLLARIQQAIDSGSMGPEALRSMIAKLQPAEIGLAATSTDPTLDRFKLSLLTEGSGTQIFSTTFVQWAARECLRRAQPETLLLRYAPRQQQQPMNVMLSAAARPIALDPNGSLIDADLGAYYTWINMNRLTGADKMSFLVWHQGGTQAIVLGPNLPHGTTSNSRLDMSRVLALLS